MNAVTIGIESSAKRQDRENPVVVQILDPLFLVVYIVEITMRFAVYGPRAALCNWVKFDFFLVTSGTLDLLVKLVVSEQAGILSKVTLLRVLRVVRLDSISSIYRPLIDGQPILSLYFIGSILVLAV